MVGGIPSGGSLFKTFDEDNDVQRLCPLIDAGWKQGFLLNVGHDLPGGMTESWWARDEV